MTLATAPAENEVVHTEWYWPVGAAAFAVALAIGVTAQRGGLLSPNGGALWAAAAAVPWIVDAVLFLRKRSGVPVWLFTFIVVGAVVGLEVDPVELDWAPFFLVLLNGEMATRLTFGASVAVMLVSMAAMLGLEVLGFYDGAFVWLLGIGFGWAGGFAIQRQFLLLARAREEQQTLAERAAADERQRIAREIHDVVAHSLAVTMLHLTGARLALHRDPNEAEEALLQAERLGRESLAEIRRTVGLLAPEGTGTAPPLPAATDIAQLVNEFEAAGLDVDFDMTGDPGALPPATGLGLYRVAQESLSNVVRHAPGTHTTMSLRVGEEVVSMHVRNALARTRPAPGTDGGLGVRGMRERVTLLGGELRAGPEGDAWSVDVELPCTVEPA
jgi:signal transduction histidine kinase